MNSNEGLRVIRGGAFSGRRMGGGVGTSALLALSNEALEIRRAATAEALLFNHVLHNGAAKERNLPSLLQLFRAVIDLGQAAWPAELRPLYQNRDVLHLGSGQTLYCAAFRALGASSYTGADANIDVLRKKFRHRASRQTVDIGISLSDAMRLIPAMSFVTEEDLGSEKFDLVLLQSVTHKLPDLETTLARLQQALRDGGQVWFLHENFYAWGGHQGEPRNPAAYDPENPQHREFADWAHVTFDPPEGHRFRTSLNRVRLGDLRKAVEANFEIEQWKEVPDRPAVAERLTPDIRDRLEGYSEQELLTRQIVCVARKPRSSPSNRAQDNDENSA